MKEQNNSGQVTIDEALESYKILRVWYKVVCVIAVVLMCSMIAFVIWGIFYADLRWMLIVFGVIMGICSIALYFSVRGVFIKAGAAILDYFRIAEKMSEARLIEKAKELNIPIKANKKG